MSTRFGRWLEDWSAWRACRRAQLHVQIPEPEPKLNVFETFLHLRPWQRFLMIVCCTAAYVGCIQSTLMANVGPHLVANEFREAFRLGAFVILLTAAPLLIRQAPGLVSKLGLSLMALFMGYATLNNACNVQKEGNEARRDGPRQKAEKIARLDNKIAGLQNAFAQAKKPANRTTKAMVDVLQKQADELIKSADNACGWGRNRTKCKTLEGQRNDKLAEVAKLQADKDLTDMLVTIEGELWTAKQARDAEGAAPTITGKELERLPGVLADFGIPLWFAQALSDHNPETESMGMELVAMFGAPASVLVIFRLFGLCVSTKTEARDRMLKHLEKMSEAEVKTALPPAPVERPEIRTEQMEPDHSEESVLKIEGKELPEFVHAPEGDAERIAAGALKAAPEYAFGRKARRPQPRNKDSARLYIKENTVPRDGRFIWASDAIAGYEAMCKEMNLEPISGNAFGRMMNSGEFPHIRVERLSSGRTKYHGIGLRNNFKVVAA
jgi:RFX DNA-binding domain